MSISAKHSSSILLWKESTVTLLCAVLCGRFFHLNCLKYKRIPNNNQTTWICPSCHKKVKATHPQKVVVDDDDDDVTFIQTL